MARRFVTSVAAPAVLLASLLSACENSEGPSWPEFTTRYLVSLERSDLVCGSGQCTLDVQGTVTDIAEVPVPGVMVWSRVGADGAVAGPIATSDAEGAFTLHHTFADDGPETLLICAGSAERETDDLCVEHTVNEDL